MVGEHTREVVARECADLDQRVTHPPAGRALECQRVFELLLRDETAVDHRLAHPSELTATRDLAGPRRVVYGPETEILGRLARFAVLGRGGLDIRPVGLLAAGRGPTRAGIRFGHLDSSEPHRPTSSSSAPDDPHSIPVEDLLEK